MSSQGSISRLLAALQNGDQSAANGIVKRYFDKLARMADRRLKGVGAKRREADGQDVAQSALVRVIAGIQDGKYPELTDREQLWGLLFRVMEGKASNQGRRERAAIRGGGKVRGDSAFDKPGESIRKGLDDFEGIEPSPQDVEQLEATLDDFLSWLDEDARRVVFLRLQGYMRNEIASECECAVATVDRHLNLARTALKQRLES